jgi:uncharacterized protein (DUF697 family)
MDTPEFDEDGGPKFDKFQNEKLDEWMDRIGGSLGGKLLEDLASLPPFNIVVAGNTGVGKSTLINVIFGKELTEEAVGPPQTSIVTKVTRPPLPFCLYDTRGLEVRSSEETIRTLTDHIKGLRAKVDAADQIHAVWLCILASSNRVEPVHEELLKFFRDLHIPCMVVLTQPYGGDGVFLEKVNKMVGPLGARAVIPVMAKPLKTAIGEIPSSGVDVLVNETLEVLPEAQKQAFESAQLAVWDRKLKAARSAVNWATAEAVAAEAIPIPGGAAVALVGIETMMLLQINKALGVAVDKERTKAVAIGAAGVVSATVGGKLVFAEAIKFIPFVGSLVGAVVGASIAVPIVRLLGRLYIDVVSDLVKSGKPLPGADQLIGLLKRALKAHTAAYVEVAKNPPPEEA